jgi:hypothetical protein
MQPQSATGPRNQQTTFRAKTHQHAQWKLARLAACAAPSDRWPAPVRPVATTAAQQAFQRASMTSLGPGTKPPPKHNLH